MGFKVLLILKILINFKQIHKNLLNYIHLDDTINIKSHEVGGRPNLNCDTRVNEGYINELTPHPSKSIVRI